MFFLQKLSSSNLKRGEKASEIILLSFIYVVVVVIVIVVADNTFVVAAKNKSSLGEKKFLVSKVDEVLVWHLVALPSPSPFVAAISDLLRVSKDRSVGQTHIVLASSRLLLQKTLHKFFRPQDSKPGFLVSESNTRPPARKVKTFLSGPLPAFCIYFVFSFLCIDILMETTMVMVNDRKQERWERKLDSFYHIVEAQHLTRV